MAPTAVIGSLRIDDLAQASGIASGTIRFYQREGLIPPPRREGRVALYDERHLGRLERVKALQAKGLPLALVRDLMEREDRGEDVGGWLALDTAVFGAANRERFAHAELEALGLSRADVDAIVDAGAFTRAPDGSLSAAPGMLDLTRHLVDAGVDPATIGRSAALVAGRVRGLAEAIADLGWDVFAPERERIAAGEDASEDVLSKLLEMRTLALRIVGTMFPHDLDEAVRARGEAFATQITETR